MLKERYEKRKEELRNDETINKANRYLFRDFFKEEETRLKRRNGLVELDEGCYKTLYGYIIKLRNVNKWFKNKTWTNLSKDDIKRVYNDLEDGKIVNSKGTKFKDLKSYYTKVFKSHPFRLAKKDRMAKDVLALGYTNNKEEVRFIKEETFRRLIDVAIKPEHKCLLWLAWDIGENISALLQLEKKDFVREIDSDNGRPYYRINLRQEILKRSRRARGVKTNYKETTDLLDIILRNRGLKEEIFTFAYRNAADIIDRAVKLVKAKCIPKGQLVTWKDLRSSMACHLLSVGWTREEVNARLGHTPSSKELDKYINFLALDDNKPKKKFEDDLLTKVQVDLQKSKQREELNNNRVGALTEQNKELQEAFEKQMKEFEEYKSAILPIIEQVANGLSEAKYIGKKDGVAVWSNHNSKNKPKFTKSGVASIKKYS